MQDTRSFAEAAEAPRQTLLHRVVAELLRMTEAGVVRGSDGAEAAVYGFGQYEYYGCLSGPAETDPRAGETSRSLI